MVNIVSVIYITDTIAHYNSWAQCWAALLAQAGPQGRPNMDRLRQSLDLCEQTVAQMFNVPIANAKDISVIFGNSIEAIRRLREEPLTRNMLLDPNNKVCLQIRQQMPGARAYRVAVIYAPQMCHIVKSVFEPVQPGGIIVNVLIEE